MIRELLSGLLRRDQYVVHLASDAETALHVLQSTCIGVILVDRQMPGRDGDWLVEQLHDRFPATAVILATGEYTPAHVSERPGVAGYLEKPFSPEMVREAVANAMVWHRVATRRQANGT